VSVGDDKKQRRLGDFPRGGEYHSQCWWRDRLRGQSQANAQAHKKTPQAEACGANPS
jgi:hypothetical protein